MFDPALVRRLFPALQQTHEGFPVAFFEGPAGTQCPRMVLGLLDGHHPRHVAESLAARAVQVCDGHYYALTLLERLSLADKGGMVRVGLAHYSTAEEIDRLVAALDALAAPEMVLV